MRIKVAASAGLVALALILGALAFQYLGGFAPCEMCHWQRWPLIGAAIIGVGGAFIFRGRNDTMTQALAALAVLLVTISGAIGAYQAGVEWHWWAGPAACTGARFEFAGLNHLNDQTVVRCDVAAWRLFGISLAGYNAIVSLGTAAACLIAWRKK